MAYHTNQVQPSQEGWGLNGGGGRERCWRGHPVAQGTPQTKQQCNSHRPTACTAPFPSFFKRDFAVRPRNSSSCRGGRLDMHFLRNHHTKPSVHADVHSPVGEMPTAAFSLRCTCHVLSFQARPRRMGIHGEAPDQSTESESCAGFATRYCVHGEHAFLPSV